MSNVTSRAARSVAAANYQPPRSVAPTAEPIRSGTINACVAELHTELLELETTVSVLAQHLEPISKVSAAEGSKAEPAHPPMTCQVAQTIVNGIDRIVQLRNVVNAITERLEIQ